jgi:hypothetical protein
MDKIMIGKGEEPDLRNLINQSISSGRQDAGRQAGSMLHKDGKGATGAGLLGTAGV